MSGNLKFDVRAAKEAEATRLLKVLGAGLRFVVAGSTLEGEEAALREGVAKFAGRRSATGDGAGAAASGALRPVAALLEQSGIPWVRRSGWKSKPPDALEPLDAGQIVLLDTIGELASIYSLAAVAFVGGSLVPAGGHNPLEPAQFGVPIVMGPHYANFRAMTEDLRAHDAIRITSKDHLAADLVDLLRNPTIAVEMGARAKQVFDQQAGATARTVDALQELLAKKGRTV